MNYTEILTENFSTPPGVEKESRGRGKRKQPRSSRDPPTSFPSASAHRMAPQAGFSTSLGRGCSQKWDRHGQEMVSTQRQPTTAYKGPSRGAAASESRHDEAGETSPPARSLAQGLDKVSFSNGSDLDKALTCLQSLENLWLGRGQCSSSEKEKQSRAVGILSKCFKEVENPWEAAVFLTRTAKDYVTAKPSCLAYFCMRTFSK